EPSTLDEVAALLARPEPRARLLEAVQALRRRSLVEYGQKPASFTLQSVVLEDTTERLVSTTAKEIEMGQPALLRSHPVVLATARDYLRRSQELLLAQPVLEHLRGSTHSPERRLGDLLDAWRGQESTHQKYGPGNVVNLLRLLRSDLQGLYLTRLAIRQA